MKRQLCMSRIGCFLEWKFSRTRQQYCRSESFAMKTDIFMNGSTVKNHISLKTGFRYNANTENFVFIVIPSLSTSSSSGSHPSTSRTPSRTGEGIVLHLFQGRLLHRQQHQVIMRLEKERIELKVIPLECLCHVSMLMIEQCNPLFADSSRANSEILESLQEFRENLVDERVLEHKVLLMRYL